MQPDLSNTSVLVVDDDPLVHSFFKVVLKSHGIDDIVCVDNGKDALEAVNYHPHFDLAFADIIMPGMSGLELVKSLGRSGFAGKVAVMTARERRYLDMAGDLGDFFGSDVIAKLAKPLRPNQISRVLGKLMPPGDEATAN